jgi:L-aspartate oxidase
MNGAYATADVLVIGAGIAGASVALRLADAGLHVIVLASMPLAASASGQALGGIAAAIGPDDSPAQHLGDTLVAGAGLCRESVVRQVVEQAPASIAWLVGQGVAFDEQGGVLHLTREAGHSRRRIVHSADATGRAVMTALGQRLAAHPRITLLLQHRAIDLITGRDPGAPGGRACCGARVLDETRGASQTIRAEHVVLATGGASGIYRISSNAARPVGDGIAMAWRAGCRVANLEMVQFHPTALRHPQAEGWLVTEAVRGEGGRLLLPDGERFMFRHDPRGELAPRDIVARAIHAEMTARGLESVWLDISHADPDFVRQRFPNTFQRCAELGIDITRQAMPVAPAAHFSCGGVVTGDGGSTDLPGLYALGEAACTGLHGANRLASNSLLEGLVYGERVTQAIRADAARSAPVMALPAPGLPPGDGLGTRRVGEAETAGLAAEIRAVMSHHVGIVRNDRGLESAVSALERLRAASEALYQRGGVTGALLELRNLACVAMLVARSALLRRESRGAHFNSDHPLTAPDAVDTVLPPDGAVSPCDRAVA